MSREIDFEKPLSDEDKQYLLNRGNSAELRKAGLMEDQTFNLDGTPGSLPEYQLKGEPEPVFDPESKAVGDQEDSVSQPQVLLPDPSPTTEREQVEYKAEVAAPAAKTSKPAKA